MLRLCEVFQLLGTCVYLGTGGDAGPPARSAAVYASAEQPL